MYIYIDQRCLSLHVPVQVRGLEHQHSNLYTTFAQLHPWRQLFASSRIMPPSTYTHIDSHSHTSVAILSFDRLCLHRSGPAVATVGCPNRCLARSCLATSVYRGYSRTRWSRPVFSPSSSATCGFTTSRWFMTSRSPMNLKAFRGTRATQYSNEAIFEEIEIRLRPSS